MKNIFIIGKPGCGKTSLIMEILKELNLDVGGFYTSEIRKRGERLGFKITSLDGRKGILAHVDIKSPYKVSKYKVNLKDLEEIGVNSILKAQDKNKLIIIDEIGKMELCSEKFKRAVEITLDSKSKVLGTIKLTPDSFTNKIKQRKDTEILHLTKENREKVKEEIINFLKKI